MKGKGVVTACINCIIAHCEFRMQGSRNLHLYKKLKSRLFSLSFGQKWRLFRFSSAIRHSSIKTPCSKYQRGPGRAKNVCYFAPMTAYGAPGLLGWFTVKTFTRFPISSKTPPHDEAGDQGWPSLKPYHRLNHPRLRTLVRSDNGRSFLITTSDDLIEDRANACIEG